MEYLGIIIAIAAIGLTMVGVLIAMLLWMRIEFNSLRNEAEKDRLVLLNLIRTIEDEMKGRR